MPQRKSPASFHTTSRPASMRRDSCRWRYLHRHADRRTSPFKAIMPVFQTTPYPMKLSYGVGSSSAARKKLVRIGLSPNNWLFYIFSAVTGLVRYKNIEKTKQKINKSDFKHYTLLKIFFNSFARLDRFSADE